MSTDQKLSDEILSDVNGGMSWAEIGSIAGGTVGAIAGVAAVVAVAPLAIATGVTVAGVAGSAATMGLVTGLSGAVDGGIVGGAAHFIKDHI
ncbi:hypothetical protein [Methylobacterium sp. P1-11]|uniref:hypothetical protein n=1 Tax=Methylobacterium sp. P1-11 TaxID=2024616 RepID=UPI0011ECD3E1|nr:hypothetical protein [Methylobacterium sp. P1-11]